MTGVGYDILRALGISDEGVTEVTLRAKRGEPAVVEVKRMVHDTPETFTPILQHYEVKRCLP